MRLWFLCLLWMISPLARPAWKTLDGVQYVENPSNDGDSFHAKRNTQTYIFRLYFVDTPETDARYPDRVKDQAEYFGVTSEQAVAGGKAAAKQIEELLADKPFDVETRYEDARGASDQKRYYSMVAIEGEYLDELLVRKGLARVYGLGRALPDGTAEKKHWSRLRKLEKEAKEAKRGLWGVAEGTVVMEGQEGGRTVKLKTTTPIFSKDAPHAMVGQLPKGWEVTIGEQTRVGFRKVSFVSPGGADFTGEIQNLSVPD